ncbi:MAG TPA: glutathione S-transferase family protein [Polyangiaceae bacterium]|jgi:glutathione S-transferase
MSELTLYIGNKNYSSWSLRAWLSLKHVGTPFKEVVIPLEGPGILTTEIGKHSPSGKVPVLRYGEFVVWDTMAIQEYLAEEFHQSHLWPSDRFARATARSVSAEMHAGFGALRTAMPMNIRRKPFELRRTEEVEADVARVQAIWSDCRRRFGSGGAFLFGRYSIADSMFAPVATRFRTYGVPLDDHATAYVEAIYALPSMKEWVEGAKKEYMAIEEYDRIGA